MLGVAFVVLITTVVIITIAISIINAIYRDVRVSSLPGPPHRKVSPGRRAQDRCKHNPLKIVEEKTHFGIATALFAWGCWSVRNRHHDPRGAAAEAFAGVGPQYEYHILELLVENFVMYCSIMIHHP